LRFALLVGTAVSALTVANPAAAFQQTGTTGTTGAHSVTDTASSTGGICIYKYDTSFDVWELKRIVVNAPKMKAVPGMGSEKVGWSFTIQRRTWSAFSNNPGPWQNRLTSATFTANTNSSTNASFTQQGAKVIVPADPGSDAAWQYRVNIKMTWYKANGTSVLGTATGRVEHYAGYEETNTLHFKNSCWDYDVQV